jgi:metal-sulfur cluster biosynthetic enzyme
MSQVEVLDLLKDVLDPELMMSVVDLGLIYRVDVQGKRVEIDYTLTYPGCPVGEVIERDIEEVLKEKTGATEVVLQLVWDPPWRPEFMSEEARLSMGYPI